MTNKRVLAACLLFLCAVAMAQPQGKAPVYVQLFARSTDHVNLDVTEMLLTRHMEMLREARERHPEAKPSILYLFSGTVSDVFHERNNANRLVSQLREAASAGLVEAGYDGAEEPTPRLHPYPNFRSARTPEARWAAREEAINWFLNEYKDPLYGDVNPDRAGGLRRMQEVFGEAVYISGFSPDLHPDAEAARAISRLNRRGVLSGLPEPTTLPARNIFGYSGGVAAFSRMMSPDGSFSPELFWKDGRLRLSDFSGGPMKVVRADEGPAALKTLISSLDRSRIHIVRVELGHPSVFLKPEFERVNPRPLLYAYVNTKLPRLPADATRPLAEIDAAFGREQAAIEWLAGEFFPANPGSRFVSASYLSDKASQNASRSMTAADLAEASRHLMARWKIIGNHPPEFGLARGEYYSLAEMFQALCTALAGLHTGGRLPPTVALENLYGPMEMPIEDGPSQGSVTVASLAEVAARLTGGWRGDLAHPFPANAVPAWIDAAGLRLNAAQFLKLLAQAYLDPIPSRKLSVTTCQMFHAPGTMCATVRHITETGTGWTLKPARLLREATPPSD